MNDWLIKWMNEWMDRWVFVCRDEWMWVCMYVWMDEIVKEGWKDENWRKKKGWWEWMNEWMKEGNNEWRKNWVLVMLIKIINIFFVGFFWVVWIFGFFGEYFVVFDCREYVRNGGGWGEEKKWWLEDIILVVYFGLDMIFLLCIFCLLGRFWSFWCFNLGKKKDLRKILFEYVELVMWCVCVFKNFYCCGVIFILLLFLSLIDVKKGR